MNKQVQKKPNAGTNALQAQVSRKVAPGSASPAPQSDALYASVARSLKQEIVSGRFPVGAQLPTEAALCARFNVSRNTIRDALKMLRNEKLVASRQGAGTIVTAPSSPEAFVLEAQSINDLVAYATDLYTEIDSTRMETVKGRLSARAGIAGGTEWLVVRGIVRSVKSATPVCLSEYYINREFAAVARLLQRHNGPVFLLIEDMFGLTIGEMDQDISTSSLTAAQAGRLGAETGATAIIVRRSFRTSDGEIAQIAIHTHPATRFKQSMKMRRYK